MTLESATAALTKIMHIEVNIVRIGKGDYVPVGNLQYAMMLAREALGLPRVPGKP